MSLIRKLKPDRNFTGALIPLAMLPIFGVASLALGLPTGLVILAVMVWGFTLFYLLVFVRTRNFAQIFISIYSAFLGFWCLLLSRYINTNREESQELMLAYFSCLIFFGVVQGYLVLTRKFKWRGREIFELAAKTVEETGNGYTSRPRPIGKIEYSLEQIYAFARFCARNLIALPYSASKNITLVLVKMGDEYSRLLGLSGDYRDATWINFDLDGEVSVHISQKDYLDYREPLAFDQLCTSLGEVFIDFFEMYKKGEGIRAIDRMDDLRLGILS